MTPSRSALLAAGLLALVAATPSLAQSRRPVVPVGVSVDVSRLRALGLGSTADLVGATLAAELRAEPPASPGRVVVRLTGLSLNAYAGADAGGGGGGAAGAGSGTNTDYLEGEILVLGPRGEVLTQRPMLSALPAASGGAYYVEGGEQRRVAALARHFAAWLRRTPI